MKHLSHKDVPKLVTSILKKDDKWGLCERCDDLTPYWKPVLNCPRNAKHLYQEYRSNGGHYRWICRKCFHYLEVHDGNV